MRKLLISIVLSVVLIILTQIAMPGTKAAFGQVTLSFQPSFGESLHYKVGTVTNANVNGTPTKVIDETKITVLARKVAPNPAKGDTLIQKRGGVLPDSLIELLVRYDAMDYGYFVNEKPLESRELEDQKQKLVGRVISIRLTADGKLAGWTIPRGLGYGQDELDVGEATAAELSSYLFPTPQKPLSQGDSWERSFEFPIKSKKGGQITTTVSESYTFEGTAKKKKEECAKLKVVTTNISEGEVEISQERRKGKLWVDSESHSKGEVIFSIQRGLIIESSKSTKQETSVAFTLAGSTKAEEFTYSSETRTKISLIEK
ncbi:MAG: hypothetical protein QME66_12170 [Candidatus Eisenbacteria bacterium]|nr:hypothetical protein [Candidatus Eisenbacteria bacterium]